MRCTKDLNRVNTSVISHWIPRRLLKYEVHLDLLLETEAACDFTTESLLRLQFSFVTHRGDPRSLSRLRMVYFHIAFAFPTWLVLDH